MLDRSRVDLLLTRLGEQLEAMGCAFELTVVGGASLQVHGFTRTTTDVDVVAIGQPDRLESADPLPAQLREAASRVAADHGLDERWLNSGPADLLRSGLPEGFADRVVTRAYGCALTVHFAGRYDLIHFKLYATVDQGAGRHEADLRALAPRSDELIAAARWARTHDPSPGFLSVLERVLAGLGVADADLPEDLRS